MTAIVLVGLRPLRIHSWVWPVGGAALVVLVGYEPFADAVAAVARQWNVLLFILGLMALSAAAEESGAFEWITQRLLESAKGSQRRLFVYIFLTAALVSMVLSNDATAIALTPIVYRAVSKRGAVGAEPFLFGSVFVANAASFGLPFSNPANILILPHARLPAYLWHLGPAQVAAIAANLAIFLFFFRHQLRGRYEIGAAPPLSARAFPTLLALAAVVAAYVVALLRDWPLGAVAAIGGALALGVAGANLPRITPRISWGIFALLAGLFVLFDAVTRAGFTQWALAGYDAAMRYGTLAADAMVTSGVALAANGLNNLPVAVASAYVSAHAASERIAYPLILGVDVGPNLFTTGSIATLLWLGVLRRYGVHISRRRYLALGAICVPVTLALGVLWLWFVTVV